MREESVRLSVQRVLYLALIAELTKCPVCTAETQLSVDRIQHPLPSLGDYVTDWQEGPDGRDSVKELVIAVTCSNGGDKKKNPNQSIN